MNPTFDHSQYTELGVGDRVEAGHYKVISVNTVIDGEPNPHTRVVPVANHEIGAVIFPETETTYLRRINADAVSDGDNPGRIADATADALGLKTNMGRKALAIALANIKVLDSKQLDYGSGNIAAFGEYGVLVRTWDKISRLRNLLTNVQDPKNESVEDSWLDLANYDIIAVLCRRGDWR